MSKLDSYNFIYFLSVTALNLSSILKVLGNLYFEMSVIEFLCQNWIAMPLFIFSRLLI